MTTTMTIEVETQAVQGLAARAQMLGVPVERIAAQAVEELDQSTDNTRSPLARALALRRELAAAIQAGTRTGGAKLDAAAELRELREERFADAA